ncbi:ABC transporter permease [Acutalibacter sp. 1XD8-36]|uniref:ABC transporter permease n=1 Tax=Acutalibacter sp. 1XD8-36 TaxID=2320852 RepID=UPI001412BEDA|nr:ABC transporter permease [Acutalibacter sp. 1XD8-36]NBJ89757.1 ABC transporter permease [Acutalibacter sp. 1XD8-36]
MIFRLARLQISSHRMRTGFVAVAVVLTAVLYMTVISFAYCALDSIQLSKMLASGSDIHAFIFDMGYSISGEALREEIQSAPEVSETFLMSFEPMHWVEPAEANSVEQGFGMLFVDREKVLPHLFMTLTEGRFPKRTDEILLCRETFPTLSIGDQVRFFIKSVKVEEPLERTYTVSGFYHSEADVPPPAVALYGEHVAEELELGVVVQFHSSFGIDRRLDAVVERLSQWETPGGEQRTQINYAFVAADLGSLLQPDIVLMILLVIGVLFLAAFLLIYNVYSIALTQDMRAFGLLKVIGMTHRQMKKLTLMQTGLIACGALPVGLAAGYFIGFKLLSPIFMSMSGEVLPNRFSPIISLISAGLTLFTLFFSALRPLVRIKKMTPIQSISPEPDGKAPKKEKRREAPASPRSLAMAGLRRSWGRMLVTSLSAMVSVLLFILVGAFTEIDTMIGGKQLGMFDVELGLWDGGRNGLIPEELTEISQFAAVEPDIIESLASSGNVEETWLLRFQQIEADITPGLAEEIRDFMAGSEYDFVRKEYQDILDSGSVKAAVLSIPDALCREIVVSQEDRLKPAYYDGEELYDGKHVLCVSLERDEQAVDMNLRLSSGDALSLSRNYSVIHLELPSGIWTALGKIIGGRLMANPVGVEEMFFLLPESVFEREFPDAPVFKVLVNAKDGRSDALLKETQTLIEGRGVGSGDTRFEYLVGGRLTDMIELQERLGAIQLTGYSLCGIIFLIGLMNMVNSALTSTVLRRREFAMLETVGMTRSQLRLMLIYENSVGGVFGLAAFVAGSALTSGLLTKVSGVKISAISLPAAGSLLLLFVVGAVAAELSYRIVTKASLSERVKWEE